MSKGHAWATGLVGVILVVVAGFAIDSYHDADASTRELMEFSGAVVGGLGVVFGAFYGFILAAESAAGGRTRRALEIIDQLNQRDLVQLRIHLEAEIENSSDPFAHLTRDKKLKADAHFLLGLLEDLALAVRTHVADEQALYDSLSFLLPHTVRTFRPFIDGTRSELGDKTLFAELDGMAASWSTQRSYRRKAKSLKAAPTS